MLWIDDATDMETLKELNLAQFEFDGVLVSIGDDLEASLLVTLNALHLPCKELWVKAKTDAHHTIIESLGVEHIIYPEQQMGMRIAQAMNYPLEDVLFEVVSALGTVGLSLGLTSELSPAGRW